MSDGNYKLKFTRSRVVKIQQAPITLPITQPTNPIGHTSVARAIHPEIALDLDDAVSSRHGMLTLHPDGSLILRDIGSSNGTLVNGKEIAVMADIAIALFDRDGVLYLKVLSPTAILTHEEHAAVTIPQGDWEIRIQREYSPEGWRYVAD